MLLFFITSIFLSLSPVSIQQQIHLLNNDTQILLANYAVPLSSLWYSEQSKVVSLTVHERIMSGSLSEGAEISPPPPPKRHPTFVESSPLSVSNIGSLLTEYYNLLIRLAYFSHEEIAFPPHATIDTDLCGRLNLDTKVIEIMQSIPFPATYQVAFLKPVLQSSRAFVFTDPEDILASRDPESSSREVGDDPNLDRLQPWELPIAAGILMDCDTYGYILLLDVKNGTIRKWGEQFDNEPRGKLPYPRPDDMDSYLNFPTRPAEEVLKELVEDVKLLEQIPIYTSWRGRFTRRPLREWPVIRAKIMELGWNEGEGDEWDREEWERIKDEVWEGEVDKLFDEQ